jgi:hypothetical protein
VHQDCLHLVVCLVPHHHPLGAVFTREIEQKAIPAKTSRFFDAKLILQRKLPHILPLAEKRNPPVRNALAQGVCLGCGALAQGVIEMPNNQLETALLQAVKQAETVRPT